MLLLLLDHVWFQGSHSSTVFQAPPSDEAILFQFMGGRRKARVRVAGSDKWSSSFALDAVDSSGVVDCHNDVTDRTYPVSEAIPCVSNIAREI